MNKIHFISGLPRSGTTLLAGILGQNPAFVAGVTSPVTRILQSIEFSTSQENEFAVLLSDEQKLALRRGVFSAVYPGDCIAFDKGHFWTAKMGIIALMFPSAKVIACVRDISWIMDSFERLWQANPLEMSVFYGFKTDLTVYMRCARLGAPDGVVGRPYDALKEAYYGPFRDRLMLVDYTKLTTQPMNTMLKIYEFLGEPFFQHDFNNVELEAPQLDRNMGMPRLHDVRREVKFRPRDTILPPDLFDRYRNDAFWQRNIKLPVQDRRESA